ncbi:MAG: substrate-binding domain-containing protein [Novosphingobium sp.]
MGELPEKQVRQYRVTSFDVAALAGVSQSTVSRALAGDTVVSEATRARVAEAARQLKYHVDENAARLRTGKTGTLAVVVICRDGGDRKHVNPFYHALLGSICAAASARGYETLVSFQDSSESLWGLYEEQRKADGMIVIGTTANQPAWDYFRDLTGSGAHIVCWGSPYDELNWIRSDNHEGGKLATRHLLDRGYRKIVCIAAENSPQRQFKERYDGYAEQMREAGLTPHMTQIDERLQREDQGRAAVRSLIASEQPFDAVFSVCDQIALGVLEELRDHGQAIPGQVGLVGFDGIHAGAHASPPLTTIEPDFQAAGEMLVDKLMLHIAGKTTELRRVPVRLLERASTRALA